MRNSVAGIAIAAVLVGLVSVAQAAQPEIEGGGGTPREELAATVELAVVAPPGLVMKKTYFRTVNDDFLTLTTDWINLFPDTTVLCPGSSACVIAVTVTSQFGKIDPVQVARVRVFVNGVLAPPGDDCCLNISRNAGQLPQT